MGACFDGHRLGIRRPRPCSEGGGPGIEFGGGRGQLGFPTSRARTGLPAWPGSAAQNEMPVRFAERIRVIEGIRHWRAIPELVEVHEIHMRAFRLLLGVKRDMGLREFTEAIDGIVREQKERSFPRWRSACAASGRWTRRTPDGPSSTSSWTASC
ncbi:unnamed protein product [Prorocentrum cordatum]|uniref:Uncharacterized protein n=1 Tax=Prorocentrum cordatum TaxID=2364126 RepID=A0ABN9XF93_9DINO|nr:unnamed protein product [Polarella glacialis]